MQDLVDHADINTVTLDVASAASISAAKESVHIITGGMLDILVNCA
jgi:NAD(P)-dependent dehydrogenase (short-subunit alcohol dehydrogenase family)